MTVGAEHHSAGQGRCPRARLLLLLLLPEAGGGLGRVVELHGTAV
jgi:hypothetical protein